jgi:hypothetical protein
MPITWQQGLCAFTVPCKVATLVHVIPLQPPKQNVLTALHTTTFSSLCDSTLGGGASDVD